MIRTLALIMARGGSKGIPGKNLRKVGGKPLILHTFEAASASRLLDRTVLSTDDPAIAEAGRKFGVDVPFVRPVELAGDASPVIDATLHALSWLSANEGYNPGFVMLLQPTSPLRAAEDIDNVIRLAVEKQADAVVSVTPSLHHPYLAKKINKAGDLADFIDSPFSAARRQDMPASYSLNGAVYLVRTSYLLNVKNWCPPGAYAYVMPNDRSLDVDSAWDLDVADYMLSKRDGAVAG